MPVTITDNYGTAISLAMPDEQEPIALAVAGGSTLTITPGLPSGVVSVRFAMLASASVRAIVSALAAASGAVVASAAVRARISAIAAAGAAVIGSASVSARGSATGRVSAAVTGGASIVARGRALLDLLDLASLFDSGTYPGGLYQPHDLSNVFTDAAGTTNATTVDDACRYLTDNSGNGHHFVQAAIDEAPRVKTNGAGKFVILTDGIDDGITTTNTVDFSAVDVLTVALGVRPLNTSGEKTLFGTSDGLISGRVVARAPVNSINFEGFIGAGNTSFGTSDAQYNLPDTRVMLIRATKTQAEMWLDDMLDASVVATSATYSVTSWGNRTMTLGYLLTGIQFANAQFTTIMAIGRDLTEAQRLDVAARIANDMGHTI
jgi:hypothetical protein